MSFKRAFQVDLVGLANEPVLEFMRADETALEFMRADEPALEFKSPENFLGYVTQVVSRRFFPVKIYIQIDQSWKIVTLNYKIWNLFWCILKILF
jgi:hypothetical protein